MELINKDNIITIKAYDIKENTDFEYGSHKCLIKEGFFSNKYEYVEGFINVYGDIFYRRDLNSIYTKNEVLNNLNYKSESYFIKDNKVFEKPRIVYYMIDGSTSTKHYETYNEVIETCKNIKNTYKLDFILV